MHPRRHYFVQEMRPTGGIDREAFLTGGDLQANRLGVSMLAPWTCGACHGRGQVFMGDDCGEWACPVCGGRGFNLAGLVTLLLVGIALGWLTFSLSQGFVSPEAPGIASPGVQEGI